MSNTWQTKVGATPGKLVLVGGLFATFVGVLTYQFGDFSSLAGGANGSEVRAEASRQTAFHVPARPAAIDDSPPVSEAIPQVTLAQALRHNPFGQPKWSRPEEVKVQPSPSPPDPAAPSVAAIKAKAEAQRAFEELESMGVSAIMIADGQRIAVVGNRQLRVGDEMSGLRVLDISKDGVILAPLEPAN